MLVFQEACEVNEIPTWTLGSRPKIDAALMGNALFLNKYLFFKLNESTKIEPLIYF